MKIKIILLCYLTLFAVNLAAQSGKGPLEHVKESTEFVLSTLRDPALNRDDKWQKISKKIYERFDIRSMSQSILATNWKSATPEERRRFVEYLSQYIESTYRSKIESYTNQEVNYIGETITENRATVETAIVTEETEIPVNYKMRNNNGEWYVYDVIIEGVSMINSYRSTFSAIVKNEGMDGLLNDIQKKIEDYKKNEEQAEEPVNSE
jgi:phospholipid transport system substrate-binding protein